MLLVVAGHEVNLDIGVRLPKEVGPFQVLALHHSGIQLLSFNLITNLIKIPF